MLDKRDGKAAPLLLNQDKPKHRITYVINVDGFIQNMRFLRTVIWCAESQIETKSLQSMLILILCYFNKTHFLI